MRLLVHPPQENIKSHFNLIQNPGWQFNEIKKFVKLNRVTILVRDNVEI